MEPHKTIVALRLKTHKINNNGECVPPAIDDTNTLLFEIKGNTENDIKEKCLEFKNKVKEWILQINQ